MSALDLRNSPVLSVDLLGKNLADPQVHLLTLRGNHKEAMKMFGAPLLVDLLNNNYGTNMKLLGFIPADRAATLKGFYRHMASEFFTSDAIAFREFDANLGKELIFAPEGEVPVYFPISTDHQYLKNVAIVTRNITSSDLAIDDKETTLLNYALTNLSSLDLDIIALSQLVSEIIDSIPEFRFISNLGLESRMLISVDYDIIRNSVNKTELTDSSRELVESLLRLKNSKQLDDQIEFLYRVTYFYRSPHAPNSYNGPYAGLQRHCFGGLNLNGYKQYADFFTRPSHKSGVVVEVPEKDIPAITQFMDFSNIET